MANIETEDQGWPEIRRLETTDPALGGESGVMNAQALAIAIRLNYLRSLSEAALKPDAVGSAAFAEASSFATDAQGRKADSAVQSGDLGSAAYKQVSYFATAEQGQAAESALKAADLSSTAPGKGSSLVGYQSGTVKLFLDNLRTAGGNFGAALVGFLQSGGGVVSRTVQDKLRESISVMDYGAVGDGVTDDSAALQVAFDNSATLGRRLHFPAKTYVATGLNYSGPGITADAGAVLKHAPGTGSTLLTISGGAIVEGITIDGNAANVTGMTTEVKATGDYPVLRGVTFKNCRYRVLSIDNGAGGQVLGCRFINNGTISGCTQIEVKTPDVVVSGNVFRNIGDGHCVRLGYFNTDTPRDVSNVTVVGNVFKNSEHVGVTCELGAHDCVISSNVFDALESGVKIETGDSYNISITGNSFINLKNDLGTNFNLSGDGVVFSNNRIAGCLSGPYFNSDAVVTGNLFLNSGTASRYMVAIQSTAVRSGLVSGNVFRNITGGAINAIGGCVVSGNRIDSATEAGIRANGSGSIITGNRIDGAATGLLFSAVTGTTVTGNIIQNCATPATLPSLTASSGNIIKDNLGVADIINAPAMASGVVTISSGATRVRLDTESSAAAGDLITINGGATGQVITCFTFTSARDVTLRDGTGNLRLAGDCALGTTNDRIRLEFDGTNWCEISRSING